MAERHTPGPWHWWDVCIDSETMLVPEGRELTVDDAVLTLGWVSCGDGSRGKEPSAADARLIAAAPDLLEALQTIVDLLPTHQATVGEWYWSVMRENAIAAIRRATGG